MSFTASLTKLIDWLKKINELEIRFGINSKEAVEFSASFHLLLKAKVSIVDSVYMLKGSIKKKKLKSKLERIYFSLLKGHSLSYSLKSENFPSIIVEGAFTGESAGRLEEIMHYMKTFYERENKIKAKMQQAMLYPCALIAISIAAVILISVFVMPPFTEIFYDFETEPPLMTRLVINFSKYCSDYWMAALIGFAATGISLAVAQQIPSVRYCIDFIKLKLPYVKNITQKAVISRFTGLLSIHLAGNQFLCEALEMVAASTGNKIYEKSVLKISNKLKNGFDFETALESEKIYPNLMIYMSRLGGQSGSYEDVMKNIAALYENEAFTAIERATMLIEPAILALIAGIALVLGLAVIVPVYDILDQIMAY